MVPARKAYPRGRIPGLLDDVKKPLFCILLLHVRLHIIRGNCVCVIPNVCCIFFSPLDAYAHDASARIIPESIPCASHLYKVRLPARAQSGRVHKVTNVHPPGHYWAKDLQGMLVHTSYLQGASSFKKQWSK